MTDETIKSLLGVSDLPENAWPWYVIYNEERKILYLYEVRESALPKDFVKKARSMGILEIYRKCPTYESHWALGDAACQPS